MAEEKTIRVITKQPGELPVDRIIPNTLDMLRGIVGGHVTTALNHKIDGRRSVAWVDSDARMKASRPALNFYRPKDCERIFGGVVVCALEASLNGLVNSSLTDREAKLWRAVLMVAAPETLMWLSDVQHRAHAEGILHDVDGKDWIVIESILTTNGVDAARVAARAGVRS